ncbi:MAG: hypothetical protein WBH19_09605 [Candidatus Nanopelagicales bacterium]|nr:hypothetical protein [Actinomycetota bacterium]NCG01910.1 hypothetical protein [Actinomycetales bacterium]
MQQSRLPIMLDQIARNIPSTTDPIVASATHVRTVWTPLMIDQAITLSQAEPEIFTQAALQILAQLAPTVGTHD